MIRNELLSDGQTKTGLRMLQWDETIFVASGCCGYAVKLNEQGFDPYCEYYVCGKCRKPVFKTNQDMPPIRYQMSSGSPVNLAELEVWVSAWTGWPVEDLDLGIDRS